MAQLKTYTPTTSVQGVNGFGVLASKVTYNTQLAATTNTTWTVPFIAPSGEELNTNQKIIAIFGYQSGATIFVANGASAVPDTSGAITASAGIINPPCWTVKAGDVLNFYAIAEDYISIALYAYP